MQTRSTPQAAASPEALTGPRPASNLTADEAGGRVALYQRLTATIAVTLSILTAAYFAAQLIRGAL